MAGRGRGKPTMSFNTEQLGVTKGELPAQVLQPPLAYPILDLHISNFESTNEIDYLVELKRDFAEYMRDSVNNVLLDVLKKDIERYSDHYQDTIVGNSAQEPKHDWSRMPAELAPLQKHKIINSQKTRQDKKLKINRRRRRIIDDDDDYDNDESNTVVQNTEAKLEQQKNTKQTQGNLDKDIKEEQEEDEENSEEEMEEYEEVDEEMDDGTDYVNNYFDNGEGFDDEDDNLDDGATY